MMAVMCDLPARRPHSMETLRGRAVVGNGASVPSSTAAPAPRLWARADRTLIRMMPARPASQAVNGRLADAEPRSASSGFHPRVSIHGVQRARSRSETPRPRAARPSERMGPSWPGSRADCSRAAPTCTMRTISVGVSGSSPPFRRQASMRARRTSGPASWSDAAAARQRVARMVNFWVTSVLYRPLRSRPDDRPRRSSVRPNRGVSLTHVSSRMPASAPAFALLLPGLGPVALGSR